MRPPEGLVNSYFTMYAEGAKRRSDGVWFGGCPICREGNSWGVKHRLYWLPQKDIIHCHNCNRTWSPMKWMIEVSNKTYEEIRNEFNSYEFVNFKVNETYVIKSDLSKDKVEETQYDYPYMTIMLDNEQQLSYYKNNLMVKSAIEYINKRRLNTAYNTVSYGYTMKDFTHKNRLVIPFRDFNGNVIFYQTRLIDSNGDDSQPKYLSKKDSIKSVFGIDKVQPNLKKIYITEGPIDSCFVPNGVSMAGIITNDFQEEQLSRFFMCDRIWILDNDFTTNIEVLKKYLDLIKRGERVFIWPNEFSRYKDINEICVRNSLDVLPSKLFDKYSFSGDTAISKIKDAIKKFKKDNNGKKTISI